ncbi:MAG: fibronectin type III domain-containing protein [Alteromonadales bacterium]|nr:fibronectin type III domain-containing protein [Alteromonadales bacterium]
MLKLREISITKLISSPQNIALLAVIVVLVAFVGNKLWQEYQIYQINKMVQTYPTAAGGVTELVITWEDYATNEDGYLVERRSETESEYTVISTLAIDSTSYTDTSTLLDGEYCYRIAAFNQSGTTYSDDSCIMITTSAPAPTTEPEPEPSESITITSEFSGRPGSIELNGREFYSFKSNYPYNEEFSIDEVSDLDFVINKGLLRFKDSRVFIFKEQGEVLDKGFAKFKFNEKNSFSFVLQGNGQNQVATLYLSFGAWGEETGDLALNIEAGETTHLINLPSNDRWHYATINISFNQLAHVNVTIVGSHKGKGAIKVAGVILNEPNQSGVGDSAGW